jgi:hypothetical protein
MGVCVGHDQTLILHHLKVNASIGIFLAFRAAHNNQVCATRANIQFCIFHGPWAGCEPLL